MKEHLEEAYLDLDEMTEPQLLAQYFRTFDLDKSGRIDGLELMKAMLKMNSKGRNIKVMPITNVLYVHCLI